MTNYKNSTPRTLGRHAPGYEWGVFRQPMNNVVPSSGEAGRRRWPAWRDAAPCATAGLVDPMDNEPHRCKRDELGRGGRASMQVSRAEQRITDPFPPSGRPLTCDDARLANGLLLASAQVVGSSSSCVPSVCARNRRAQTSRTCGSSRSRPSSRRMSSTTLATFAPKSRDRSTAQSRQSSQGIVFLVMRRIIERPALGGAL